MRHFCNKQSDNPNSLACRALGKATNPQASWKPMRYYPNTPFCFKQRSPIVQTYLRVVSFFGQTRALLGAKHATLPRSGKPTAFKLGPSGARMGALAPLPSLSHPAGPDIQPRPGVSSVAKLGRLRRSFAPTPKRGSSLSIESGEPHCGQGQRRPLTPSPSLFLAPRSDCLNPLPNRIPAGATQETPSDEKA